MNSANLKAKSTVIDLELVGRYGILGEEDVSRNQYH
jgi:hypothetical protein